MNAKKLNFTRLNTSVLNASLLNSSIMGGRGKGSSSRPSGLIAQYKPYLNSNDSPTRDVLKDYSGHGNDVVLHNFAYAGMSGYGGYSQDFSRWEFVKTNGVKDAFSFTITGTSEISEDKIRFTRGFSVGDKLKFKLKISGIPSDMTDFMILNESTYPVETHFLSNGINEIELEIKDDGSYRRVYFIGTVPEDLRDNLNIKIEQLPLYPGALVSDGVDDYGSISKPLGNVGTVIIMLDEIKWNDKKYLHNIIVDEDGNRLYCWKNNGQIASGLPSTATNIDNYFISFTREPQYVGSGWILFGANSSSVISVALYALEIYDRDLTEEEIEIVKQRMIAEYEKATGNVLEGTILLEDGTDLLLEDGTSLLME